MRSYQVAKTWHTVFSETVYQLLNEQIPVDAHIAQCENPQICEFGRWLERIRPQFGTQARYNSLDIAHALFHRVIGDLLRLKKQGCALPEQALASFRNLSELVEHCLLDFEPVYTSRRLGLSGDENVALLRQDPVKNILTVRWSTNPIVAIEQQHMCILALLNELQLHKEKTTRLEEIQMLLSALQHIFREHFEFEEGILRTHHFDAQTALEHSKGHNFIIHSVTSLFSEMMVGQHLDSQEVFRQVLDAFMIDVRDLDEHLLAHSIFDAETGGAVLG